MDVLKINNDDDDTFLHILSEVEDSHDSLACQLINYLYAFFSIFKIVSLIFMRRKSNRIQIRNLPDPLVKDDIEKLVESMGTVQRCDIGKTVDYFLIQIIIIIHFIVSIYSNFRCFIHHHHHFNVHFLSRLIKCMDGCFPTVTCRE